MERNSLKTNVYSNEFIDAWHWMERNIYHATNGILISRFPCVMKESQILEKIETFSYFPLCFVYQDCNREVYFKELVNYQIFMKEDEEYISYGFLRGVFIDDSYYVDEQSTVLSYPKADILKGLSLQVSLAYAPILSELASYCEKKYTTTNMLRGYETNLAIDFDGVLAEMNRERRANVLELKPNLNLIEALNKFQRESENPLKVCIHTARPLTDFLDLKEWLVFYKVKHDFISMGKYRANRYLDDKAVSVPAFYPSTLERDVDFYTSLFRFNL